MKNEPHDNYEIILEFWSHYHLEHTIKTTYGIYKHWSYAWNIRKPKKVLAYTMLIMLDWLEHEEKYKKIQQIKDNVEKLLKD